MKKVSCIIITVGVLLFFVTTTCFAAEGTAKNPTTGDVASVIALTLAGLAAIGGFLLRKVK